MKTLILIITLSIISISGCTYPQDVWHEDSFGFSFNQTVNNSETALSLLKEKLHSPDANNVWKGLVENLTLENITYRKISVGVFGESGNMHDISTWVLMSVLPDMAIDQNGKIYYRSLTTSND